MLNLHIIALGKLKESYWREAEAEYRKRLHPYAKISLTEIPEESFHEGDKREIIQKKEAEKILKHWPEDGVVIALHERGKAFSSPEFANFLEKKSAQGDCLTFVIGGPLGLHESILTKVHAQISLSELTFPHQMVRTIFLEQIYRSVTITKGKKYHY